MLKLIWIAIIAWCIGFLWFDLYYVVHYADLHNTAQTAFFGTCAVVEVLLAGFAGGMLFRELQR